MLGIILGIILGVKQYADYENTIAELISRRSGVVPITLTPLSFAYNQNLDFPVILSLVSSEISSKVRLDWVWSPENKKKV